MDYFSLSNVANHIKSWLGQCTLWRITNGRHGSDIYPNVSEISLRPSGQVAGPSWTHNYSKPYQKISMRLVKYIFKFCEDCIIIIIMIVKHRIITNNTLL